MKLDFHTHGKLAKRLPFSIQYTDWLFQEAKGAGLDALCLTEHFNTLQFDELYGYLLNHSEREGDTILLRNGLRVFPGMETDIAEGGHILSLGTAETILELNQRLAPYKAPGNFLPFEKLMNLFRQYDVLVGAAHPYREGGHIPELPAEQLKRLDFLDLNGKDVAENRERAEKLTYSLGAQIEKPVVSGSDTHQAVQYGCIWTDFTLEITTLAELRRQMQAGNYRINISDQAAFQVKTACILKRALKEIHALGGDYVGVLLSGAKEKDAPSFQDRIAVVHETMEIDHAPESEETAKRLQQAADEMALKGFELVSAASAGSAKEILIFRKKGAR